MKRKLIAAILAIAMLLPLVPAASVFAEGEKPVFYGTSLTLENNLAINFVVDAAAFTAGGFSEPQVTFSFLGEETTETAYTEKDGLYYFTFHDIAAMYMKEDVTATLSAVKDSVRVWGDPITESVASYCVRALADPTVSRYPALRTLIADLLTYGAKSQLYFNHRTDDLATNAITAEYLNAGTKTVPSPGSCKDLTWETAEDTTVVWYGASLKLMDSVNLQFYFTAADTNGLYIEIRDGSGELIASFRGAAIEAVDNYYRVCCKTVTPDRMRDELFITAYSTATGELIGERELPYVGLGDEAISNTIRYSIESYVVDAGVQYGSDAALRDLLYAMLNYGASVEEYISEGPLGLETPMTRARLDELPVAQGTWTMDQKRDIVLQYYNLQSSFLWTPSEDFTYLLHYFNPDTGREVNAGYVYSGVPYSSATSCLQHFLDFCDEETGVFSNPYGDEMGSYLGNSCTSSIYWAWGRISTAINFKDSRTMTPTDAHGLVKVGNYAINGSTASTTTLTNFDSPNNTYQICEANGLEEMSKAYAQLLPGDAIVAYVDEGDTINHAQIVSGVKVVYTDGTTVMNPGAVDATKTIDPSKSVIYLYEQNSPRNDVTLASGQGARDFGKTTLSPYFSRQYNRGYLPVTCKELAHEPTDRTPVYAATAGISGSASTGYNITEKGFGARNVTSNYAIARVLVTIKDRTTGDVVTTVVEHVTGITREYNLNSIRIKLAETLEPGVSYDAEVKLDLSNGEILTAWAGRLVMPAA